LITCFFRNRNNMLRTAIPADLDAMRRLYRDTILSVNIRDYTREQVNAWAARWTNMPGWNKRMADQHVIVDDIDGHIGGFSSLTKDGHVDLLFVHKDHQGEGVARRLMDGMVTVAMGYGLAALTTDASVTARPFFERMGFTVVTPQTIMVDGVALNNFKMTRAL